MELSDFIGEPCKSKMAFEFIPKKKQFFDLSEISKKLLENGFFIEVETPYLLILKLSEGEASFFRSGKIIVKQINRLEKAKAIVEKIVEKI